MLNNDELEQLKQWYDDNGEYPDVLEELVPRILDCLGDDEEDIISFINDADIEMLSFLSMVTEELYEKFQSDEMDKALDKLVDNS